jgi:hypothetical protein
LALDIRMMSGLGMFANQRGNSGAAVIAKSAAQLSQPAAPKSMQPANWCLT